MNEDIPKKSLDYTVAEVNALLADIPGKAETTAVPAVAIAAVYGTGTAITTGADLDSLETPGVYQCETDIIASSLSNCPTLEAFRLEVKTLNTATNLAQTIYTYELTNNYPVMYQRIKTATGWHSWMLFSGTAV